MKSKIIPSYPEITSDIKTCQQVQKNHGKSYYFATRFLTKSQRIATYATYAWMRIPDDWIDSPTLSLATKKHLIEDWRKSWEKAQTNKDSHHPVLRLASKVFETFDIKAEYSNAFLDSMEQDLTKTRYQSYQELEKYMYGSAGVVGAIMSLIIGCKPEAIKYAITNGYAMQMTNFLRDVGEDFEKRNRIYIPNEALEKFKVSEETFSEKKVTENFVRLMKDQIAFTKQLYSEAYPGIKLLEKRGQPAVKVATNLYAEILEKISQNNYDVFNKRAHTSLGEKIIISIKSLL